MVTSNRATSPSLLSSILKSTAVGIKIPCCSFTGSYIYHLKQQSRRTNRSLSIWSVCVHRDSDLAASPAGKCSYTSFHAHSAREQRHAQSHTHTHSSNSLAKLLFCTRVFSHQGHEHFKVFCQQNHLNWLPLVCAACHRGQRWRQHSWTQGPSPPSSIPPHLLKHLKVPHSVLSYANLRVKQSILTKRLYATL